MRSKSITLGRIALATQGALYVVLGLLALQIARGQRAQASQKGALAAVARQPFGLVMLAVLTVGLAAHALWRMVLAARGEPGDDEDGRSVAKRAANAARAALYLSLVAAAVAIIAHRNRGSSGGGSGSGSAEKTSTAVLLALPGGQWILIAVALGLVAAAAWNAKRGVTRSFLDKLDCTRLDEHRQRTIAVLGVIGYLARAFVYLMVGWFLYDAARQRDPGETHDLDGVLTELLRSGGGRLALWSVALGLVLFGVFRIIAARLRKPHELTHS